MNLIDIAIGPRHSTVMVDRPARLSDRTIECGCYISYAYNVCGNCWNRGSDMAAVPHCYHPDNCHYGREYLRRAR